MSDLYLDRARHRLFQAIAEVAPEELDKLRDETAPWWESLRTLPSAWTVVGRVPGLAGYAKAVEQWCLDRALEPELFAGIASSVVVCWAEGPWVAARMFGPPKPNQNHESRMRVPHSPQMRMFAPPRLQLDLPERDLFDTRSLWRKARDQAVDEELSALEGKFSPVSDQQKIDSVKDQHWRIFVQHHVLGEKQVVVAVEEGVSDEVVRTACKRIRELVGVAPRYAP